MPGFGKGKATQLQLASRLAAGFNSSTRITLTTPVVLSLLKRTWHGKNGILVSSLYDLYLMEFASSGDNKLPASWNTFSKKFDKRKDDGQLKIKGLRGKIEVMGTFYKKRVLLLKGKGLAAAAEQQKQNVIQKQVPLNRFLLEPINWAF